MGHANIIVDVLLVVLSDQEIWSFSKFILIIEPSFYIGPLLNILIFNNIYNLFIDILIIRQELLTSLNVDGAITRFRVFF